METRPVPPISILDERISDLFRQHPQLVGLFIKRRMACARCSFTSFCSLKEALETYNHSQDVLDEIFDHIRPGVWVGNPN